MPLGLLVPPARRTRHTLLMVFLGLAVATAVAYAAKAPVSDGPLSSRDGIWSFIPGTPTPPPSTTPPVRMIFGAAWDAPRQRMIVFGGHPTFRNDTWVFASGSWQQLVTAGPLPSPRYGHSCVYDSANDRLVVFGGFNGSSGLNDVWTLSLSGTPTWSQLATLGTPPSGRYYSASAYDVQNQRLVLFGGHDGAFLGDTWTLSLGANPTWTNASAGTPPPSRDLAHGIYDASRQRMVMFGGWSGSSFLNDTWQLSLAGTPTWSPLVTTGTPLPRRENSASYDPIRDRMIIFGGLDTGYPQPIDETWSLSFQTNQWTQLPTPPPPGGPRTAHESVYDPVSDRVIVHGGYDGANYLSSTMALNLTGPPVWSDLSSSSPAGSPSPRREYSAVYDPAREQMVLFSGTQQSGPLDRSVWTLPLADADPEWVPHLLPGGPNPRHGQIAVWDGPRDRMLMFGGYDDVTLDYTNELWQLDFTPAPAWTLLAPSGGPPSPRMVFGMIHDPIRDRLIIMGGHPQHLNDVWSLPLSGPNAMQWTQLSPSGTPPAPRWGHTFVYDPERDRAILFGGTSAGPVVHDDVWALKLSGETSWKELSPNGHTPEKRFVHSAIYDPTRKRMVVYGGANYDPSFLRDTWELRLAGAKPKWKKLRPVGLSPGERDLITSIYDAPRNRLVFFGGFNGSPTTFFNDTWFLTWGNSGQQSQVDGTAQLEGENVVVTWDAPGLDAASTIVYRRHESESWLEAGVPQPAGEDQLVFIDSAGELGGEYTYRLGVRVAEGEEFGGEATIQLPVAVQVRNVLELAPVRPNPSPGSVTAEFSLPDRSAARLALVDLAGRVVASREVGMLGPGTHRVDLTRGRSLPVGMYFIRLDSGGRSLRSKVTVIR